MDDCSGIDEQLDVKPLVLDVKPDVQPLFLDVKPDVKPLFLDVKPDVKPLFLDVKPDVKPLFLDVKPDVKPVVLDDKPDVKPLFLDVKPEVKPLFLDVKPDVKCLFLDVKSEAQVYKQGSDNESATCSKADTYKVTLPGDGQQDVYFLSERGSELSVTSIEQYSDLGDIKDEKTCIVMLRASLEASGTTGHTEKETFLQQPNDQIPDKEEHLPTDCQQSTTEHNTKVEENIHRQQCKSCEQEAGDVKPRTYCKIDDKNVTQVSSYVDECHAEKKADSTSTIDTESVLRALLHSHVDTGQNIYRREICEDILMQICFLQAHKQNHARQNMYKCDLCGKGYKSKQAIRNHLIHYIDQNETPHRCDICGKGFGIKSKLKQHSKIHIAQKPYICDVCGKGFGRKGDLQRHSYMHTGQKPHICDVCSKGFGCKGNLQRHSKIHTGQKTHICVVCGKGFGHKVDLQRHYKIHTGQKPHICAVCGKGFRRKDHLKTHSNIHHAQKNTHM